MFRSLKAKFIIAFGTLIVVLFAAMGLFLIDAKRSELSSDIAQSVQSFSQLTAQRIVESYEKNAATDNFIPLSRELSAILRQNSDVEGVQIVNYSGVVLYDSVEESIEPYDGPIRTITNQDTLDRVQSNNYSLLLDSGEVVYVMVDDQKDVSYVDLNEDEVAPLSDRDRIVDVVVPYNDTNAVFYEITYASMEERLLNSQLQISAVALLGVALTLMISFMLSVSITNPLKALKVGALKIATGDFSTRVAVKTKDEIGVLAGTFNQMAEELAAATEAKLYQERVQKELELASQIQADLLPKEEVKLDKLDISGGLVPASEIGGDAFDYIPMSDGRYLVYLGDVTGHGVPAGIVSSIANALLYGLKEETDLNKVVQKLNEVIVKKTTAKVFMTMALALWDSEKNKVYYVNAGHPPVLYYDAEQSKLVDLNVHDVALGMMENLEIHISEIDMKPNDVFVMYSDGVPEAVSVNGDDYGMQRLKRIVQDAASDLYTAKGIKNAVLSDVVQHIGEGERKDDMTVVVLKRRAKDSA